MEQKIFVIIIIVLLIVFGFVLLNKKGNDDNELIYTNNEIRYEGDGQTYKIYNKQNEIIAQNVAIDMLQTYIDDPEYDPSPIEKLEENVEIYE